MSGLGKICAVSGCFNYEIQQKSRSFFTFPCERNRCEQWILKSKRTDIYKLYKEEGPSKHLRMTYKICSDHFLLTDFKNPRLFSQGLKPGTVPSQNLPINTWTDARGMKRSDDAVQPSATIHGHVSIVGKKGLKKKLLKQNAVPTLFCPTGMEKDILPCTEMLADSSRETLPMFPMEESMKYEPEVIVSTLSSDDNAEPVKKEPNILPEFIPVAEMRCDPQITVKEEPFDGSSHIIIKEEPLDVFAEDTPVLEEVNVKSEIQEDTFECPNDLDTTTSSSSFKSSGDMKKEAVNIEDEEDGNEFLFCRECKTFFQGGSCRICQYATSSGSYTCSSCKRSFAAEDALTQHSRVHSDRPYFCDICNKAYKARTYLTYHENQHTGKKSYSCSVCHKRFYKRSYMLYHSKKHTSEKPFSCSECNKEFKLKSYLNSHIKNFHGMKHNGVYVPLSSGQTLFCPICKKTFLQKLHVNRHSMFHGLQQYVCTHCNEVFLEEEHLYEHLKSHGVSPYECSVCEKRFIKRLELKTHMRLHGGDTAVSCWVCQKLFLNKYGLMKHMTLHSQDNPYSCCKCKESFSQQSDLIQHVQLHIDS